MNNYGWIIIFTNAASAMLGIALMQVSQWHRSVGYRLTTAFMLCALGINSYLHIKASYHGTDSGSFGECLLSIALLTRIIAGIWANNPVAVSSFACRGLILLAFLAFTGCASTSFSVPVTVQGEKGQTAKAVKIFTTQADIVAPTSVGPGGITFGNTSVLGVRRVAVVDSKGNVRLDKAGNPVFNEYPVVAGIYHSTATEAAYTGGSFLARSIGSLIGTIAASVMGAQVASSAAGAVPAP